MNTNYIDINGLDKTIVISYYEKLKNKIYSIIYYLEKSVSSLDEIDEIMVNYYYVDGDLPENVNIKKTNENIKNGVSYLKNTIIPSINSKINSLK